MARPGLKLSVITPTNDPRWLAECYASLAAQTAPKWEWVIVPNAGVTIPDFRDERVRIVAPPPGLGGVGALKRWASNRR